MTIALSPRDRSRRPVNLQHPVADVANNGYTRDLFGGDA